MRRRVAVIATACALAATGLAGPALADGRGAVVEHGTLIELNDSGVAGTVTIVGRGDSIRVNLSASGLEAGQLHMQHIHGVGDGNQATCPDMSLAGDDGILTIGEGLPAYGPVKVTLGRDMVAGSDLGYSRTFNATDAGATLDTLGELTQYVVVVHGLTVEGAYVASLPVACAVLEVNGRAGS